MKKIGIISGLLLLGLIILGIANFLKAPLIMEEIPLAYNRKTLADMAIKKDLALVGLQEETLAALEVEQLKDVPVLEDNNLKLYRIYVDHQWLEGLLVYQNQKYAGFLPFMSIEKLFFIEGSGKLGLLGQGYMGSGLLYNQLSYLNLKKNVVLSDTFYNGMKGFTLKLIEGKIMVYSYDLNTERTERDPIGELILEEVIRIDGFEPFLLE